MRDIRTKFRILNLSQFLDIDQISDGGISSFQISGLYTKIVITTELAMILTWTLDQ